MSEMKDTNPQNPKDAIGSDKLPLRLITPTAKAYTCLAMLVGALKYGQGNFFPAGASAAVYIDALDRHRDLWFSGQDNDEETGLSHLAHMLACILIIAEAKENGNLIDDRQYPTNYVDVVKRLTPEVRRLKELFADRNPKHWTRADAPAEELKQEPAVRAEG